MKKEKFLGLMWIIVGTFIGAGFVSGKEIYNYFSRFGFLLIVMVSLSIMLFYFFVQICLNIGRRIKDRNNYFYECFGRAGGVFKFALLLANFILVGSMLSGSFEVFDVWFSKEISYILVVILMLLTLYLIQRDFSVFSKINTLLIPFLLSLILVVCIIYLVRGEYVILNINTNTFKALFSVVDYVCFNLLTLGVFLIEIGGNYSEYQIKKASLWASIIIGILLLFVALTLFIGNSLIACVAMPLVTISFSISKIMGVLMQVAVFIGLFTSLISTSYVSFNYVNDKIKNKWISSGIVFVVGLLVSLLGFSFIVVNLYAVMGGLGLIFLISIFCYYVKISNQKYCKKTL